MNSRSGQFWVSLLWCLALSVSTCRSSAADGAEYWDNEFAARALDGQVWALFLSGSSLFVGGEFSRAGDIGATNVAQWDGASWLPLGNGLGFDYHLSYDSSVNALAVWEGRLYAGGRFAASGSTPMRNVAVWDGQAWSALGQGIDGLTVRAIAATREGLVFAGTFNSAGGIPATNVARWSGQEWSPLGAGLPGDAVDAVAVLGETLYAAGRFCLGPGSHCDTLARWDGARWSKVAAIEGLVRCLQPVGEDLILGGGIDAINGVAVHDIVRWDGVGWHNYGSGMSRTGEVSVVMSVGSMLYAGGFFSGAGDVLSRGIACWDGAAWLPLGTGVGGHVSALATDGSRLFVGGGFYVTPTGRPMGPNLSVWHMPRTLGVARVGDTVAISWPAPDTNMVLESMTALGTGGWTAVEQTPALVGHRLTVTNNTSGRARFYRLRGR